MVRREESQRFGRLVFLHHNPHFGVGVAESGHYGQYRPPDCRGEAGYTHRADRVRVRVEVDARSFHRAEDGCCVLGQASSGRSQPDPPTVRLDQRRSSLSGEFGDLLRTVEVVVPSRSGTLRIEPNRDSSSSTRSRRVSTATIVHNQRTYR